MNWTKNFLEKGGFDYVLQTFLSKEITEENLQDKTVLKDLEFSLFLIRVFLNASLPSEGDIQ